MVNPELLELDESWYDRCEHRGNLTRHLGKHALEVSEGRLEHLKMFVDGNEDEFGAVFVVGDSRSPGFNENKVNYELQRMEHKLFHDSIKKAGFEDYSSEKSDTAVFINDEKAVALVCTTWYDSEGGISTLAYRGHRIPEF